MVQNNDSWRHHAFPFGLQKYWRTGTDICWLDPAGQVVQKKHGRKTTGWRKYGHKEIFSDPWGSGDDAILPKSFESDFERIDDLVPKVVDGLLAKLPKGNSIHDLASILRVLWAKADRRLNVGESHSLDEASHRDLLELLFSVVDRSLFYRRTMESRSWHKDDKSKHDVGAANIRMSYARDRRIAQLGPLDNHHFLALFDPSGGFVFPDGLPNWIVIRASDHRIWGRLLVPLTPHLLVYFSTPKSVDKNRRLTCWSLPNKQVSEINKLLMLFSEEKTYFFGGPPKMRPDEPLDKTFSVDPNLVANISVFDAISGYSEPNTLNGLRKPLADHFKETGEAPGGGGEVTIPHGFQKENDL